MLKYIFKKISFAEILGLLQVCFKTFYILKDFLIIQILPIGVIRKGLVPTGLPRLLFLLKMFIFDYFCFGCFVHLQLFVVEIIITPPFQVDHPPTQVPKSPYCLKDSESEIIWVAFFWALAPKDPFVLKKKPNKNDFFLV